MVPGCLYWPLPSVATLPGTHVARVWPVDVVTGRAAPTGLAERLPRHFVTDQLTVPPLPQF